MDYLFYTLYRLASTFRQWLENRLPPAGWLLLFILILTSAISLPMEEMATYQLTVLAVSLFLVAGISAFFFKGQFTIHRQFPSFGSVDHPLPFTLEIQNRGTRPSPRLRLVDTLKHPMPSMEEFVLSRRHIYPRKPKLIPGTAPYLVPRKAILSPLSVPPIPAGQTLSLTHHFIPKKRGLLHFSGFTLAKPDPLGLFRALLPLPNPHSILILPKRYPIPTINLSGSKKFQAGGHHLIHSIGESHEFIALREYRPGDPLRHIHWKSWAKTNKPIVKEHHEEMFMRYALILDTTPTACSPEVFEEAVSLAASFTCALDTQECLLDLLFVEKKTFLLTLGRGGATTLEALQTLASLQMHPRNAFKTLAHSVSQRLHTISGCLCLFLHWDASRKQLVEELLKARIPILILILHDRGKSPDTSASSDLGLPPERFHHLEVGTIPDALKQIQWTLLNAQPGDPSAP